MFAQQACILPPVVLHTLLPKNKTNKKQTNNILTKSLSPPLFTSNASVYFDKAHLHG